MAPAAMSEFWYRMAEEMRRSESRSRFSQSFEEKLQWVVIDWNAPLKLGLLGLVSAVACGVWFVVRAISHQGVPKAWFLGLGVPFSSR